MKILYALLSFILLLLFSCENESIVDIDNSVPILTKGIIDDENVHYIESIDDLRELITSFNDHGIIAPFETNDIYPKISAVEMSFNGSIGEPYLIRENIITNFNFQTADLVGVQAYTDYYLNFYRVYATVSHPNAIAYAIRDSPVCGIIPGHDDFGTDYGYIASTVNKKFRMQTNVLKVKNKVGSSVQLNKYYPQSPDRLVWNYSVFVP
mgnify:CR=1 FL=1